jgi:hypothetical protein
MCYFAAFLLETENRKLKTITQTINYKFDLWQ